MGFEEDKDGLPRIFLMEDRAYATGLLHFGCQFMEDTKRRELVLYVVWTVGLVPAPFPFAAEPSLRVEYQIQGARTLTRHWDPGEYTKGVKSYFAPPSVVTEIVKAMQNDGGILQLNPGTKKFQFDTAGFEQAAAPVIRACP